MRKKKDLDGFVRFVRACSQKYGAFSPAQNTVKPVSSFISTAGLLARTKVVMKDAY